MMTMNLFRLYILLLISLFTTAGSASPTDGDFVPCRKIAVSLLQECLDGRIFYNKICWKKSETAYKECVGHVRQRTLPNKFMEDRNTD